MFGKAGSNDVITDMQKLHDRKDLEPNKLKTITHKERKHALDNLMFLNKNRCGKLKGCGCADGIN